MNRLDATHPVRPHHIRLWFGAYAIAAASACGTAQFPTTTIYETSGAFVRLETDRALQPGTGHSHPAQATVEQIAAALGGVMIVEQYGRMPFDDDAEQPRRHRAFTDRQIAFFAPLLAQGLGKATPEEVVTFYLSEGAANMQRYVTSGGLFVDGEELHLVLSNYRSRTYYMADTGSADNFDDRRTPMESIAPQSGRLEFEPPEMQVSQTACGLANLFRRRREIVVLYRQLQPRSNAAPPASTKP